MKKIYLIDTSSFFFRSYYAIKSLSNRSGLMTNAIYGLLLMIIKLIKDQNPQYIVFCYDSPQPSFRKQIDINYKSNRREMPEDLLIQLPYAKNIIKACGFFSLEKSGYEADDLIGSLSKWAMKSDFETIIISSDKDFNQLINDKINMYDPMKEVLYTELEVKKKWGVRPDQFIDYLSIVGDSSDNIKGLKGVGPKGAVNLLNDYESLDNIYKNIENISNIKLRQKLQEGKNDVFKAKELISIKTDIELNFSIEDVKRKKCDKLNLLEYIQELEFKTLNKKLLKVGILTEDFTEEFSEEFSEENTLERVCINENMNQSGNVNSLPFKIIDNLSHKEIAKDLAVHSVIWCLDWKDKKYLVCEEKNKCYQINENLKDLGQYLQPFSLKWKGYDLKDFWHQINYSNKNAQAIWDSMLAAYVIENNAIKDINNLYENYIDFNKSPYLKENDLNQLSLYDLFMAFKEIEKVLKEKLQKDKAEEILYQIELPLIGILYKIEKQGVFLDANILIEQGKIIDKEINQVQQDIYRISTSEFNISSPKQLSEILFENLKIPPLKKKMKSGIYSTNNEVLAKLKSKFPICQLILEYRELVKLKTSYIDPLPGYINPITGRIHAQFKQALTSTGRLSCVNPNLQTIPIKTPRGALIRKAFVAEKDSLLLSADYSQIELRILADITQDSSLIKAFNEDEDIHSASASEIFATPIKDISLKQRRIAKAVNFGIAYGQGAYGLSESLNISPKEADEIINKYFIKYPKVKEYMLEIVDNAKDKGYVQNLFGRKRYLPDINSSNFSLREFSKRQAINAPIQSTASDILKKAMIELDKKVDLPMILQIHDELLFEGSESEILNNQAIINEVMNKACSLSVPLKVNSTYGKSWFDIH